MPSAHATVTPAPERGALQMVEALRPNALIPIPLYAQLADRIEAAIVDGDLPHGQRLPAEGLWANRIRVSRPTVHAALRLLVDKGLIRQGRGRGTVVI